MENHVGTPLPSYRTPPVDEVACGCQFANLDRMKIPHFGAFWDTCKKGYPTIEHVMPLYDEGALPTCDSSTGLPIPRVWFIDPTESQLIQLQTDRIYYNWRKREAAPIYPRYPSVVDNFIGNYAALGKLASDMGLGPLLPQVLDLTYINVLPRGELWHNLDDLKAIFRNIGWQPGVSTFLPPPSGLVFHAEYPLPNDQGTLTVKLLPGNRRSDNKEIYSFNLSARGIGSDTTTSGMREWFDMAREWIVRGFTDLTAPEIQKSAWGRE
jgi:uncharacterized protein (TIGR04255 family)